MQRLCNQVLHTIFKLNQIQFFLRFCSCKDYFFFLGGGVDDTKYFLVKGFG